MEMVLLDELRQKAEEVSIYLAPFTDDSPFIKGHTAGMPPLDKFIEQFIFSSADAHWTRKFFAIAEGRQDEIVNVFDLGSLLFDLAQTISSDSEKDDFLQSIDNTLDSVNKAQERWFAVYEKGMQLLPAIEEKILTWNNRGKGQAIIEKIERLAAENLKKNPDATHLEQHLINRFSCLSAAKQFINSLEKNHFLFIHRYLEHSVKTPKMIADAAVKIAKGRIEDQLAWVNGGNLFNPGIELNQVRAYFLQLADPNGMRAKVFLSPEQVDLFLKRAFLKDDTIPIQVPDHSAYSKVAIQKLFYAFFVHCTQTIEIDSKLSQPKYIRLLTDNIDGFVFETVAHNFARSRTNIKTWKNV